jgi:AcrR family transcriptional regulator
MRALAEGMGVTPMALYNHFDNKRGLLAAVAAHLVDATDFDGAHSDWRHQVQHCFGALRALCLRHPGLPALLEKDGVAPASVFAPMTVTLGALSRAGLDEVAALRCYYLLIAFTLGQASYQARAPITSLEPPAQEGADAPTNWNFDASFEFCLSVVLSGIEAMTNAPPPESLPRTRKRGQVQ